MNKLLAAIEEVMVIAAFAEHDIIARRQVAREDASVGLPSAASA